ncbi:Frag1/DRAM/Sfk1 [Pisolithus croceorrhizus]|nr:Frag1/DRAM/Sfk1 [Pisolithus croceorrhizus]KAI6168174.1 Frag1/DRAM/Sfk1 [Pisolithus thermaeus]
MFHLRAVHHRFFVAVPAFVAFLWFGSLLAMLLTWLISGRPKYVSQEGSIAYISDVGASFLKPLFVVACCITGVGFLLSLVLERLLRHRGRLAPEMRRREHVFGVLSVIGAFIAMLGLALLSGFDTQHYASLHRVFLLVFMIGVALSAIFTVAEYRWIAQDYQHMRKLRRAYIAKATIAGILVALAIAFAVTLFYAPNVGAVIEWTIAFGFTLYLLTFCYDLRMTKDTRQFPTVEKEAANSQGGQDGQSRVAEKGGNQV